MFGQWLCGSVGRAVASNTRDPRFESSHWQKIIYIEHLFTVYRKDENKEKEARNGPFFRRKKPYFSVPFNLPFQCDLYVLQYLGTVST